MVKRSDLLSLGYYKKASFTGGGLKMRYRIAKDGDALGVAIWRGPYAYAVTEEEKFTEKFPFSEDGLLAACAYINDVEEEKRAYFDDARTL